MITDITKQRIQEDITNNDVVLYMKGSKDLPMCGFSSTVVQVLERLGITDFMDINVLEDPEVREGIKEFSNWPTIPQLYVKGEFIGGADITREMFQSGELKTLMESKGIATKAA